MSKLLSRARLFSLFYVQTLHFLPQETLPHAKRVIWESKSVKYTEETSFRSLGFASLLTVRLSSLNFNPQATNVLVF